MSQLVRASFDDGELDAVIVRREAGGSDGEVLGTDPLGWRSTEDAGDHDGVTSLVTLGPPCGVRAAAVRQLDAAKRPWREASSGEAAPRSLPRCGPARHRPDGRDRIGADGRCRASIRATWSTFIGDRDVRPCRLSRGERRGRGARGSRTNDAACCLTRSYTGGVRAASCLVGLRERKPRPSDRCSPGRRRSLAVHRAGNVGG